MRIAAIIAVPSEGVGNTAIGTLQSLAASPEALTIALGFQVEKVDAVPTLVVSASETSNQDADQSNTGVSITFVMALAARRGRFRGDNFRRCCCCCLAKVVDEAKDGQ